MTYRVSSAHEENGDRVFAVNTTAFVDNGEGRVGSLELDEVEFVDGQFRTVEGGGRQLKADLVLFAMGFTGPERGPLIDQLGLELDGRGNIARADNYETNVDGVLLPVMLVEAKASLFGRLRKVAPLRQASMPT